MAQDALKDYYYRLELLGEAEKRVKRIIHTVQEGTRLLQGSWWKVAVIHSPPTFPAVDEEDRLVIDDREWPDGDQLADALDCWHTAYDRAIEAYRQVPDSRPHSLPSPVLPR